MSTTGRLWFGLCTLLVVGFGVLLWMGTEIHRQAPPMPQAVVTERGDVVYTRADIELGRQVWQSIGGQQLGRSGAMARW
jgi:nitric oxide reductase subunit B